MLIQLGPPQRFTFLSTSMEVSETSMEVSIEGHGSKLPFMEASVEVGGSKLTSMEISMEVGGSRFTASKKLVEVDLLEVNVLPWKFPWKLVEVDLLPSTLVEASVEVQCHESFHCR